MGIPNLKAASLKGWQKTVCLADWSYSDFGLSSRLAVFKTRSDVS